MPASYSIHLFGTPFVSDEAGEMVSGLSLGKPLALLSYLVVQGRTSRNEVVGLLWGDVPEAKARNAFRQALHRLRAALGEDVIPQDPDNLFVIPELAARSDVRKFERLIEAGQLEAAIATYSGEFLSGLNVGERAFDEWRDSARSRFKARFGDALRTLIQRDIDAGEITRALARTATLFSSDPTDSDAATLYASILLGAGRRAEAQQLLEQYESRYKEDFGSAVPGEVHEFLLRLRRAHNVRSTTPTRRVRDFVGREKELSVLLSRMRALEGGDGSLVVIAGEEGIGKTRLMDEFLVRARDLGSVLLLQGRERSPDSGIPYASIAEALRGALDAPGVAGTGQHLLAEAARLLPQLRDQFALPSIADVSDEASRVRFYEGIAALLDSVAYEQPVCVALDDFHNCSAATYGLIEYLADRLSAAPILFIIAGRTTTEFETLSKKLRLSLSRSTAERDDRRPVYLSLGPLDHRAGSELVEAMRDDFADEFPVDDILARSRGIPFRIIEACERIRGGEEAGNIPVRLRDVLLGRLKRGTQAEQRMFVAAALFDRPVSIRLLAAASHLPERSALDAALALEREGLLHQRADGLAPAHDFCADLAQEGTGPAGRALLAGWAADALVKDESGTNAELARLFALAGRRKEAFGYSRTAAFEALGAGAIDEAKQHLTTALVTALTRDDREKVENLLSSLGGGKLLLSGATVPRSSERISEAIPTVTETAPQPSPRDPAQKDETRMPRSRPLRSAMLSAAALVVIVFLSFRVVNSVAASRAPGTSLSDSLIVARELSPRDTVIAFTTGPLGSSLTILNGATRHGLSRSWIDSLRLPWANPLPSPDGRNVAIERITKAGSELYVISMDRRDTIPLRSGNGDVFSNGWSPDGRWLLATHGETRSDGTYTSQLFGYSIVRGGRRLAFDSLRSNAVVEAIWSPDGSHVAWTTRLGSQHQQDVFVSDADGRNVLNISNDPAEDYSIAWSPDGSTVAFTSERTGRAELYAEEIQTRALRRLTWEGAHADHAAFSPDGRWLAYESTRGGNPAVYVMPSGGGTGRSVSSVTERVSLIGWRGRPVPYIDQVFVDVPVLTSPGDTGTLVVRALDRHGNELRANGLRAEVLDKNLVRLSGSGGRSSDSLGVVAIARGLARVAASVGDWRADTAFVPIGQNTLALLEEHFEGRLDPGVWRVLGDPIPVTGAHLGVNRSHGLIARSDREWESGLLSRIVLPARPGLTVDAWVAAPFSEPAAARSFVIALVAADPAEVIDSQAPHFLRLAAVSWLGDARRISFAVGQEVFTEPLTALDAGDSHRFRISIEADNTVAFFVDDKLRWNSSLRLVTAGPNSRAQLWLGSQGTENKVVFDDVRLALEPTRAVKRNERDERR